MILFNLKIKYNYVKKTEISNILEFKLPSTENYRIYYERISFKA